MCLPRGFPVTFRNILLFIFALRFLDRISWRVLFWAWRTRFTLFLCIKTNKGEAKANSWFYLPLKSHLSPEMNLNHSNLPCFAFFGYIQFKGVFFLLCFSAFACMPHSLSFGYYICKSISDCCKMLKPAQDLLKHLSWFLIRFSVLLLLKYRAHGSSSSLFINR